MNDAQTWTLIAGFLAILVAMSGLLMRVLRAEITVVRTEIQGGLAVVNAKLDHLDRDVQVLYRRELGTGPDGV